MINPVAMGDTTTNYRATTMDYRLAMAAAGIAGAHARSCICTECRDPRYRFVLESWDAWQREAARRRRLGD